MYVRLVKKHLKLDKKTKKKTRSSINEKPPKLNKETRKITDYLMLCMLLCRGEKPPKPS